VTTRRRRVGGVLLGSAAFLVLAVPSDVSLGAQQGPAMDVGRDRGTVGVFLGRTSSRQLWNNSFASGPLSGIGGGVYVDVQTPIQVLSIRAEAGYAGRGSVVWDEELDGGRTAEAAVRSHYLSLAVHGKLGVGLGALSAYVFAGPTLDFLLDSRCSASLCQVIREEKKTVFNLATGAGVGVALGGGFRTDLEVRLTEGLSDAYLGNLDSARNRTVELLVRVGKPL